MYLNIINQFTDYKLKSNPNVTYFKVFIPFALRNENDHHCQFLCQFSARSSNIKSSLRCKKRIILCVFTAHRFKRFTLFTVFRNPNNCHCLIRSLTSWLMIFCSCISIDLLHNNSPVHGDSSERDDKAVTHKWLKHGPIPWKTKKDLLPYDRTGFFYNFWGIQFHSIENWIAHIFLLINRRKSKHYFNILLWWLHHWAITITCWETVGDSSMTNDLQESA
jgi:hypothetical protein